MAADVAPPASGYQRLSLWWEAVPVPLPPRPALTEDLQVDVCIVGAGFTGLWTALSLARADPSLRVAVLEREVAGFGASGRNGGWCSALFATSDAALARRHGPDAMRAMRRAMQETVDVVGAAAAAEGIDCHFTKGGTVDLVRSEAQRDRALAEVDEARALGFGDDDVRWLGPQETRELVGAAGVIGATFTPHCAALQPALLARGLADAVERRGVRIYEHTVVTDIQPSPPGSPGPAVVTTTGGTVRADVVVRATEAWTPTLPGHRRDLVPVYSLMVATEPLGADFWEAAGLESRTTFADHRHMIIYGQRTADGRIAFGGRGAPYHYGSAVRESFDAEPSVHALVAPDADRALPRPAPGPLHPRLGRPARHPARLALLGRPRPRLGLGLGRRLRGRRGVHHQSGRSHLGRPHHRHATRRSPTSPGWGTARRTGSPSPCAGSASTPACGR